MPVISQQTKEPTMQGNTMIGRRIKWMMHHNQYMGTISDVKENGHVMVKVDEKYNNLPEWSIYCLVVPPDHKDHYTSEWILPPAPGTVKKAIRVKVPKKEKIPKKDL